MISLVSKKIIALRGEPRINLERFDRLQEWLSGVNPMAPSQKHHDSGKRREIFPDLSPAGPDDIATGAGDRSSHDNIGSGYIIDTELYGGQADDEAKPGFGRKEDKEQTFMDHQTSELAFKNDFDLSSTLNPMNFESNKRDHNPQQHLMRLQRQPKIRPRNRAAQVWQHTFKV